jgi:hypothetical protein
VVYTVKDIKFLEKKDISGNFLQVLTHINDKIWNFDCWRCRHEASHHAIFIHAFQIDLDQTIASWDEHM